MNLLPGLKVNQCRLYRRLCKLWDTNTSILQEINTYTYINEKDWNASLYAIIADGDSMSPDIKNGDEVIDSPNSDILSGDIVHYQIGVEAI